MTAPVLPAGESEALRRLASVRPAWCAVRRVRDVVPDCARTVFHAGPPYASLQEIPAPVRNSICMAAVFEGWAADAAAARRLLENGSVAFAPAQDHGLVVPLAGVLSASMAVLEVRDLGGTAVVHAAVNEGQAHATRLGKSDPGLPAHLRWLNGPFADWLAGRLGQPLALAPLLSQALRAGDDCHSRTVHGSACLRQLLLRDAPDTAATAEAHAFLESAAAFALNPWMAGAALWLRAAEGLPGCTWVSRAGGNGTEFGIQLAGAPGRWFTIPAPRPQGAREEAHRSREPVGALGDSAVVDFLGLGGQALAQAPSVREAVAPWLPADAPGRARVLAPASLVDPLDRAVVDAARCMAADRGPLVLLGMIDAAGEAGRIGGGVVDVPPTLFAAARNGMLAAAPG